MNKNNFNQKKNKIREKIKWFFVSILFILLCCINYFLYKIQLFIRIFIIFFLTVCIIGTLLSTKEGKDILLYIKMSIRETKKITFPNFKETLYTTFIVVAVTILISLLLWSLDSIIFRLITFIISLRF